MDIDKETQMFMDFNFNVNNIISRIQTIILHCPIDSIVFTSILPNSPVAFSS